MDELIDQVLDQIKKDVQAEDLTALTWLLHFLPQENLRAYLPDEVDCFNAYYNKEA